MRCIVGITANLPEVSFHRLLAAGLVFLCEVRGTVLRLVLQVVRTFCHRCCNGREAAAGLQLQSRRSGFAGDGTQTSHVDAATIRRGRFGYTVGGEDHFLVTCVLRFLVDFGECTADGLNRVSPFYFCHSLLAITRATAGSALVVALRDALALRSAKLRFTSRGLRAPLSQMRGIK